MGFLFHLIPEDWGIVTLNSLPGQNVLSISHPEKRGTPDRTVLLVVPREGNPESLWVGGKTRAKEL